MTRGQIVPSRSDLSKEITALKAERDALRQGLVEMVNLHSGEDYKERGIPMCPICERNRKLIA